jgi:antitoxin FitA-like protein
MSDMLIRNVSARLKRQIRERARTHGRSMSEEAKALLEEKLRERTKERKLGDELFNLVPPKYRGDDLIFEIPGPARKPPDFK